MSFLNPLVSVIVPTYNAEKYICECIQSICKQTYKNLEIIIVDDKSTDNTLTMINSTIDDRIKVIARKKNGGQCETRNIALDNASGKYVAFVDADDTIEAQFIEKLLENCQNFKAEVPFCDFNIMGKGPEHEYFDVVYNSKEQMIEASISGGLTNRIMNKLYLREAIKDIKFPNGRNIKEDASWTSMVLMNVNKVVGISDALYNYRVYSGSSSQRELTTSEISGMYKNDIEKYSLFLSNTNDANQKERLIKLSEPIIRSCLIYLDDLKIFDIYKSICDWVHLVNSDKYYLKTEEYDEVVRLSKKIAREEFFSSPLKTTLVKKQVYTSICN